MPEPKEFGKFSLDQLRALAELLPVLLKQAGELPEIYRSEPGKLAEIMGADFAWASIYEMPFNKQIAVLFVLLGMQDKLHEAATSEDPQERVINWTQDGSELDEWYDDHEQEIDKRMLIILATVLHRNALSIMLHQCSLDVLTERVRRGDDKAFFDAVRVDRSILSASTFADRLAKAELQNDEAFFHELGLALKGPSKRSTSTDKLLNYVMAALAEVDVTSLSDDRSACPLSGIRVPGSC